MNRREEFELLQKELDRPVPALEGTLDRAKARKRNRWLHPIQAAVSTAALFMLLVNFCTPVAAACAQVPLLRELAELVTFSTSLTQAVEHEYVQPVELSETKAGIHAGVEYLIVDEKQVNIFFRVTGPEERYYVEADFAESSQQGMVTSLSPAMEKGELSRFQADMVEGALPDHLELVLLVYRNDPIGGDAPAESLAGELWVEPERELLAEFRFPLAFDPTLMAKTVTVTPDLPIQIMGQSFTLDLAELSPTMTHFHLTADEDNDYTLEGLTYYFVTDRGEEITGVKNGVSAAGESGLPGVSHFYGESCYFQDPASLRLVITGATLRSKEAEDLVLDLEEEALTGSLPEGITLQEVRRTGEKLALRLRYPADYHGSSVISNVLLPDGGELMHYGSSSQSLWDEETREDLGQEEINYYDGLSAETEEVSLRLHFTHWWTGEEETEIPLR